MYIYTEYTEYTTFTKITKITKNTKYELLYCSFKIVWPPKLINLAGQFHTTSFSVNSATDMYYRVLRICVIRNTVYDIRNTEYEIRNTKYEIRYTIYEIPNISIN